MTGRFRTYSGKEAVVKFQKAGWHVARQKGSHVMLTKENYLYTLSVPMHQELGIGILRKLLHQAQMSFDEFDQL